MFLKTRPMYQLLLMVILVAMLPLHLSCSQISPLPDQPGSQSPEAIAYKTILLSFDAYDLGMTTLRTLQKQKVITEAQYISIRDKYGWPCWNAIKAANTAVNTWRTTKSVLDFDKMNAAFSALYDTQKSLSGKVTQLQGGK